MTVVIPTAGRLQLESLASKPERRHIQLAYERLTPNCVVFT
jgi:hypothetical protein